MNRIVRSAEPEALRTARRQQLAVIAALDAGANRSDHLDRYALPGVKLRLFADQHKKCAWCELEHEYSSSPLDHVRPKDGAWRDVPDDVRQPRRRDRPTSRDHYWWLTWTWENLLFSCARCNDQGHKANYFPLLPGTIELTAPTFVDGELPGDAFVMTEAPLLLDPTEPDFDFLDHVRWEPSQRKLARNRWLWTPMAITSRGDATVRILQLTELAFRVQGHLVRAVLPSIEAIEGFMAHDRRAEAAQRWATLIDTTLAPGEPLTAATWCGLEAWMPSQIRAVWGLPDPPRPSSRIRRSLLG